MRFADRSRKDVIEEFRNQHVEPNE